MQPKSIDDVKAKIPELLEQVPYLKLLVLFGSRARGDNQESSDWDFAVLFDEELRKQHEPDGLDCYRSWMILQDILDLGDNEMDWVDLKDASKLLAHEIAKDGVVIYESSSEIFGQFHRKCLISPEALREINLATKKRIRQKLELWKQVKA